MNYVWCASHPGLFIYCAVNVFISIIAKSYSRLQDQKEEHQRELASVRWHSSDSSHRRVNNAGSASATEFLGRATVGSSGRQSVSQTTERLASAALNIVGSIANSLADSDDVNFVTQQEGAGIPTRSSIAALDALELDSMSSDDQGEAARWRRRCLAQQQIVRAARVELLQALDKMDQQLAVLETDAGEAESSRVEGGTHHINGPP